MNPKTILTIFFAIIISILLIIITPDTKTMEPKIVYRVYLSGKSMGLIESKEDLDLYIDNEQKSLKEKYKADKVYAPENLEVVKDVTYNERISTTQEMYNKIKDIEPFTIEGYEINIKGVDTTNEAGEKTKGKDQKIYVLDKEIFTESIDKTIRSFVDSEDFDKYLNNTQTEIRDGETGSIIENIYIENKITVKETHVKSTETIYETVDDLSKYLLFGSLDEHQTYTVQKGDSISDVSFNNKLSNEEFLIANPDLGNANSLLYEGQKVTISIIKPQFRLVEIDHQVSTQDIPYETETREDNTKRMGETETIQEGVVGSQLVTSKVQKVNGQVETAVIDNGATKVITQPIKKIVVKGTKPISTGGYNPNLSSNTKIEGYWQWPTKTPYMISSHYGYRWGTLHDGTDINGPGYGSPIYAANNGIVVASAYKNVNGEYIIINHNNGYYTIYAHLADRHVSVGQEVTIGQTIGTMGRSGFATGVHLHFGLWSGLPYGRGSFSINPLSLF